MLIEAWKCGSSHFGVSVGLPVSGRPMSLKKMCRRGQGDGVEGVEEEEAGDAVVFGGVGGVHGLELARDF